MKAVALVFSARKKSNCGDLANFMLGKMREQGVEAELVSLCDYNIKPCQNCEYECLPHVSAEAGRKEFRECPVEDDVEKIWHKVWCSDIFLMFMTT